MAHPQHCRTMHKGARGATIVKVMESELASSRDLSDYTSYSCPAAECLKKHIRNGEAAAWPALQYLALVKDRRDSRGDPYDHPRIYVDDTGEFSDRTTVELGWTHNPDMYVDAVFTAGYTAEFTRFEVYGNIEKMVAHGPAEIYEMASWADPMYA